MEVDQVGMTIFALTADGDRLETEICESQVIVDVAGEVMAEGVANDVALAENSCGDAENSREDADDGVAVATEVVSPGTHNQLPIVVEYADVAETDRAKIDLFTQVEDVGMAIFCIHCGR